MPVTEADENSTIPDLHKLLSVRYISSTYKGWQTFKVKAAVESWLKGDLNLGLMITATDPTEKDIDIKYADREMSFGEYTPILTVYLKNKHEVQAQKEPVNEPKALAKKIKPLFYATRFRHGEIPCSRHIWYVNFQDLGWNNFVVAPKGYMAYRCKGSCKSPHLSEHSNHAKILKLFENLDESIDGPRCNPTNFKPLVMMFYDDHENIVIKSYKNMVVEKCGCR